jgi:hypothetical protein
MIIVVIKDLNRINIKPTRSCASSPPRPSRPGFRGELRSQPDLERQRQSQDKDIGKVGLVLGYFRLG